jgi:hypothetical protein
MDMRLWFWSRENPKPRVVAKESFPASKCDLASFLRRAAAEMFAPVLEPAWKKERKGDQLYITRLVHGVSVGYCCEPTDGCGPIYRPKVRERLVVPVKRQRERL